MSYELQDRVWEIDLPASAKLVLLALAYRADASGSCYPSLSGLCNLTGMDVKTIRKAIRSLVAEGLLEVVERGGRSPLYRVTPTEIGTTKFGTPTNIDPSQNWEDTPTKNGRTPLPNLVPEQVNNKSYNKSNTYMAEIDEEKDPFAPLGEQIEDAQAERVIDIQDDPDHVLSANEMRNLARVNLVSLNCTERLKACAERKTITVSLFNECVKEYKKVPRSAGYLVGILDRVSRDPKQMQDKIRKDAATRGFLADCGLDVDDGIPF